MVPLLVIGSYMLLGLWAAYVLPRFNVGVPRLLASLPLLPVCAVLPYASSLANVRGSLTFITTWLTSSKLIAYSAGRGALSLPDLTPLQRAALALLPLLPHEDQKHGNYGSRKADGHSSTGWMQRDEQPLPLLVLTVALKAAVNAHVLQLISSGVLSSWQRHTLYAVVVWLSISVLLDATAPLAGAVLGLRLAPSMRAPLLSTSVSDFWGKRYNQVVSAALRDTVSDPVCQAAWVKRAPSPPPAAAALGAAVGSAEATWRPRLSDSRRAASVFAVFLVSGLMHELIIGSMCSTSSVAAGTLLPGRLTAFFLIQVPIVLAEGRIKRASWRLRYTGKGGGPRAVAAAAALGAALRVLCSVWTFGVLLLSAETFFWPVLESCKVDVNGTHECLAAARWLGVLK